MNTTIKDYLEHLTVGEQQSYKNLALFPLFSPQSTSVDYLVLDEALRRGLVQIAELHKGASVPELQVINKSAGMILIIDGEELVGAKQNRIVNTSILIPALSTIVIPVSCVEQGRWCSVSPTFRSEERLMSAGLRARKAEQINFSVRESGAFRSDQHAIWEGIAEKAARRKAVSVSMAMADIYEKDRPLLENYVEQFRLIEDQVGALYLINGRIAGMECFGRAQTYAHYFRKVLESYALDAIDWFEPGKEYMTTAGDAPGFMKQALGALIEECPAVGAGTDCRLESKAVAGCSLVVDSQVVHLCLFARAEANDKDHSAATMSRFSARRRMHNRG